MCSKELDIYIYMHIRTPRTLMVISPTNRLNVFDEIFYQFHDKKFIHLSIEFDNLFPYRSSHIMWVLYIPNKNAGVECGPALNFRTPVLNRVSLCYFFKKQYF